MISRGRLLELRICDLVAINRLRNPYGEAESVSIYIPKVLECPGASQGNFEFPQTDINVKFRRDQHDQPFTLMSGLM